MSTQVSNGSQMSDKWKLKKVPDGQVISLVKAAIFSKNSDKAARKIGIDREIFSVMKKLIILQDMLTVSSEDKVKIMLILGHIERERSYAPVRADADDVISRNWKNKTELKKTEFRDRSRFEATMINVRESCESMREMNIPYDLNMTQRDEAIVTLTFSVMAIGSLIMRLVGEKERDA
jgi:hypothetical protein